MQTDCQNLDKLPKLALALIAWAFKNLPVGWDICHAIEVRLDDPVSNILNGGNGNLVTHGGGDGRCYIKHYGDDEWAVIHHTDPSWNKLDRLTLCSKGEQYIAKNQPPTDTITSSQRSKVRSINLLGE